MTFFEWTPDMSVGNEEIDEEHRQWIDTINLLQEHVARHSEKIALVPVVDAIVNYAERHFKNEGKIFSRTSYPDADAHKKEHAPFLERIKIFQKEAHESCSEEKALAFLFLLKEWMSKHIERVDSGYIPYLKEIKNERASL